MVLTQLLLSSFSLRCKHLFPCSHSPHLALKIILPHLSQFSLNFSNRACGIAVDASFRYEYSIVSYSRYHVYLWVSVLIDKGKLIWWGLREALICECNNKSTGVSLIISPFSRVMVIAFLLKTMTFLAIHWFWHLQVFQILIPYYEADFKYNQSCWLLP